MIIQRSLPNGKQISTLGFGASGVWGKPHFATEDALAILRTAHDRGVNYYDTAPSYGWGLAESRLGMFLKEVQSDSLVLSTKVGTVKDQNGRMRKDYSPAGMERSFNESLTRLGLEKVDILYLHGAVADTFNEETFRFLEREKERGRIDYSGVNSFDPAIINLMSKSPLDCIMLQMNVNDTSALPLLSNLKARNKIIFAGTILAQGITNMKNFIPTDMSRAWYLARALKNDPLFIFKAARIQKILNRHGLTKTAESLKFVISDPRITSGLFGTSSEQHLIENTEAARSLLSAGELSSLTHSLTHQ